LELKIVFKPLHETGTTMAEKNSVSKKDDAEETNRAADSRSPQPSKPSKQESAVRFDGAFVDLSRSRLAAMVCKSYD
jgi:hypothetical protein